MLGKPVPTLPTPSPDGPPSAPEATAVNAIPAVGGREAASSCAAINRLLRHENTAAETYRRLIEVIATPIGSALKPLLDGHQRRAGMLLQHLAAQHGQADDSAGAYGVLMPMHGGATETIDPRRVVSALAAMEGHGVVDYRRELRHLDDLTRILVEAELLPAQERAVAALATVNSAAADHPSGPQA